MTDRNEMSTKRYNQPRIQSFLAERVDLQVFCFELQYSVAPGYAFNMLRGQTPVEKSMSIVEIASNEERLGEIVFQLVLYWLDKKHGNPRVLDNEKINLELAVYLAELEREGNIEKAGEVRQRLGNIGAPVDFAIRSPSKPRFTHGYAVLVGVGEYFNPAIPSLPATTYDARTLEEILRNPKRCGYLDNHVHRLTGPAATRGSILSSLDWLAKKAKDDPEATIIFYFSGHGWKDEEPGSSRYCLLPYDSDLDQHETATICNDLFTKKLEAIDTSKVVVIMDACHAGGMAAAKDPNLIPKDLFKSPPASYIRQLAAGSGKVVISSSKENEFSYVRSDHSRSVFTECLVEALSGQAYSYEPDVIGILDVFNYLHTHVPATVEAELFRHYFTNEPAQQHPVIDTQGAENFPIALKAGGQDKARY
jgi:hypothetical protein